MFDHLSWVTSPPTPHPLQKWSPVQNIKLNFPKRLLRSGFEVFTETLSYTDLVDEAKLLKGYTPKLYLKQKKVLQKTPWHMFMAVTCSELWGPVYFHFSRWFSSHKFLDNLFDYAIIFQEKWSSFIMHYSR